MTAVRLPGTVAEIHNLPRTDKIGVFVDLDGTLIAGYSARHLAEQQVRNREFGATQLVKALGVFVGSGGITPNTFEQMLDLTAEGWKGRSIEDLEQMGERLFHKKIENLIYPEMREIVAAHQAQGHTVVLTSSATSIQVEPVARFLGISDVLCNRFEVDDDGLLTGTMQRPVLWGPGKADVAQMYAAEHGIDIADSYFYADGNEDTALMHLIGNPRPTNPGKEMEAVANRRGWPVLRFESRGRTSLRNGLVGMASLLPITGIGVGLGLLRRDKRAALNFISENWLKSLFAINGVTINVIDEDNAWLQRPAVFMFNHRNNFDAFIAAQIVRRDYTGVAKAELKNDPVMGTFGRLSDLAFVDRSNTAAAVEALKPIEEMAAKGLSVLIAPEGTRVDTTSVGPFKKGGFRIAMSADLPIVPIVIRNAEAIAARNAQSINPGTVDVKVLPPIPTAGWKLKDLDRNIAKVRQQFVDTLDHWED